MNSERGQNVVKLVRSSGADELSPTPLPTRVRLVLQVGEASGGSPPPTIIAVPVEPVMTVGRGTAADGITIDLTRCNAAAHGVSRLHAVFHYADEQLAIEDRGSTNGTRINGKTVTAGQVYRLRPGDELEFGRLTVTPRLVRS